MRRTLIAALLASLATAAVLAATGFGAGDKGSSDRGSSGSNGPPQTMAEAHKQMQQRRAERESSLAKRLGVSTEELRKAFDAVMKKRLDEAVQRGRLTAEQRDALLACKDNPLKCDRSKLPAPPLPPQGGQQGGQDRQGPPAGLRGKLREGRKAFVRDLAAELNLPQQKVKDALRAERKENGPFLHGRGQRGMRGGPGQAGPGPGGPGMGGPGMGGPPPTELAPAA